MTVTITYDNRGPDAPEEGDVIFSANGQAQYLVVAARKVNSEIHPHRFRYECVRIDRPRLGNPMPSEDARWFPLYWYPRGKRRPRRHLRVVNA